MDNFITGTFENIAHLTNSEQFEFREHDVTHHISLDGPLDYILNFASPASPIDYLKIPIETLKAGSLGTLNLLGLARLKGAKILIASTSEVYGDPLINPQTEDYYGNVNPIGPRGVYDEAKRFQEAITMAYHTHHGLDIAIVRIFNTYGSRMRLDDGRAIPAFIGQALKGEDVTIFGDGSQTRSFCYVDDQVDGIYKLLMANYSYPVNIGKPEEITIYEFAKEVIALSGGNSKIIYLPLPKNDPIQRRPDISLAKKLLGWQPTTSRKEGIDITFNYFKAILAKQLQYKKDSSEKSG